MKTTLQGYEPHELRAPPNFVKKMGAAFKKRRKKSVEVGKGDSIVPTLLSHPDACDTAGGTPAVIMSQRRWSPHQALAPAAGHEVRA
jgi:hypothetical protein